MRNEEGEQWDKRGVWRAGGLRGDEGRVWPNTLYYKPLFEVANRGSTAAVFLEFLVSGFWFLETRFLVFGGADPVRGGGVDPVHVAGCLRTRRTDPNQR